jgi:predicted MPP superfamily phosphohydrolase
VEQPLKILHLTDLHTHGMGRRERALLKSLKKEKPDLIVVTGDMVSTGSKAYKQAAAVYSHLDAPLGTWFVRGNWETEKKPRTDEKAFYDGLGVQLLVNKSRPIRPDVSLVGLDESREGKPNWSKAAQGIAPTAFVITLIHVPGSVRQMDYRCDLALAGDTHGGQIRLPGFTCFMISKEAKPYISGWYKRGQTLMYVSRGLGTSGPPMRLFCRPEITYIQLRPRRTPEEPYVPRQNP